VGALGVPGIARRLEENAWVGTRWMVRKRTFAHILEIVDGYPPPSRGRRDVGAAAVLTFRSSDTSSDAIVAREAFFGPLWNRGDVGVRLSAHATGTSSPSWSSRATGCGPRRASRASWTPDRGSPAAPLNSTGQRGSPDEQLGDLHGVERGTLAQVVVADKQRQTVRA